MTFLAFGAVFCVGLMVGGFLSSTKAVNRDLDAYDQGVMDGMGAGKGRWN